MKFTYQPNLPNFYNAIRGPLFDGSMSTKQVQGIDAVLKTFDGLDVRYTAYALATIYHETGKTMQPIEEYGKGKGYDYGKKLDMGSGPGHRVPYTTPDKLYYGRGHTQNTWLSNYRMLTNTAKKQGKNWDFVNHPELLLQMEPSLWATRYAMLNGAYTGKKLSDYFNDTVTQPIQARKVINGQDLAVRIAGYYEVIYKALLS